MSILTKLKPITFKPKKNYGFDIETYQIDKGTHKEQHFYLGTIYGDDLQKTFYNKHEMAEFMFTSSKLRNSIIWATSLDFDFNHTFNGTKYFKEFQLVSRNGKIIIAKNRENKRILHFLDTLNFTGASVKQLGLMLNCHKLAHPKCFTRLPNSLKEKIELRIYCMRDSKISKLFGDYFAKFCAIKKCKIKNTIASTGLDNWRRNSQPMDLFQCRKEWLLKHFEGAYKGGRTEVIKRGYIEDINSYDYNSAYPYHCVNGTDKRGSFPNPNSIRYLEKVEKEDIMSFEGISKVTMKSPDLYIPLLAIRHNHKLVFPKGIFTGWHTNIEIKQSLKMGYELIETFEGIIYTEKFIPFRKLVNELYNERLKYRKEGNQIMQQLVKDLMNSGTYGKFGQKPYDNELMIHENDISFKDGELYYNKKKWGSWVQRNNLYFIKEKMKGRIPLFSFPILSIYTTALARIQFTKDAQKYQKWLCYGDTDSFKLMDGKTIKSNTKLGMLGFEYHCNKAIFIKPKMYYQQISKDNGDIKEILKIKGVNTRQFKTEEFLKQVKSKVSVLQANYDTFRGLKMSAIRNIPFSSIETVNKTMSLEDNKRKWNHNFQWDKFQDSKPLKLRL